MRPAVVDASVLTVFYTSDSNLRSDVIERLSRGDTLFAPAHLDVEVASALRGLARTHHEMAPRGSTALLHLARMPVRRTPVAPLLQRIWELRENVTAYDAAYVALAERLRAPLITCDAKLARASGTACSFDLIT